MSEGLSAITVMRSRLARGPVRWTGVVPVESDGGAEAVEWTSAPVAVLLAAEAGNGGIHLTGNVSVPLRIRCRRCLVRKSSGIEVAIDVRLEPDLETWDEAPGLYTLDGRLEEIDLLPAVREELYLALPKYPVCRPNCLGLCNVCGTNLNVKICRCRNETMDPRWDALRRVAEHDVRAEKDDENQEG